MKRLKKQICNRGPSANVLYNCIWIFENTIIRVNHVFASNYSIVELLSFFYLYSALSFMMKGTMVQVRKRLERARPATAGEYRPCTNT